MKDSELETRSGSVSQKYINLTGAPLHEILAFFPKP